MSNNKNDQDIEPATASGSPVNGFVENSFVATSEIEKPVNSVENVEGNRTDSFE